METKRINKIKCSRINLPIQKKDFKGKEMFNIEFPNIFLLAKKNSGKTTAINTILKHIVDKNTTVMIFSSTANKDKNMIAIIERLNKRGIPTVVKNSIYDDGGLDSLISEMARGPEVEEEESVPAIPMYRSPLAHYSDSESDEEEDPRQYVFVFDDLSDEVRSRSLATFMKKNRHFRAKVIISSQYYNDLPRDARMQLDYILLFPKLPPSKVAAVHEDADMEINLPRFYNIYRQVTSAKYQFLYLNTRTGEMRLNFDRLIKIKKDIPPEV